MADAAAAPAGANPAPFGDTKPHFYPWWLILIEGIAAILIGIALFVVPVQAALGIGFFIGLYWVLTGIIALVSLFWDRSHWGWKLFWGIISVMAGWYVLGNLIAGTVFLAWIWVLILGLQGLIVGVIELVQAFKGAGWGRGILGALSVIIGGWLVWATMAQPARVVFAVPWVIGIFAVIGGIAAIVFSFQARKMEAAAA